MLVMKVVAPSLGSNEEAIQVVLEAIEKAGFKPSVDMHRVGCSFF